MITYKNILKHKSFSEELDKSKPNRRLQSPHRHPACLSHTQPLLTETSQFKCVCGCIVIYFKIWMQHSFSSRNTALLKCQYIKITYCLLQYNQTNYRLQPRHLIYIECFQQEEHMEFISSVLFSHELNSDTSLWNRRSSITMCKTISSPKIRKDLVEGSKNIKIFTLLFHRGVLLRTEMLYFSLRA